MSLSLASVLSESARYFPDRTAIILGDQSWTYTEMWESARRYASALHTLDIQPGDHVALMVPNVAQFPMAYFGILAIGAVVVPVHSLLKSDEIAYMLEHSHAKYFIAASVHLPEAIPAAKKTSTRLLTLSMTGEELPEGLERIDLLAKEAIPIEHMIQRSELDPAVILYTSGTTGRPKGAVLSNSNLVWQTEVGQSLFDVTPEDVYLGCLPLFHAFGQSNAMNTAFRGGATLVLLPRFDAAAAIALMVKHNVTIFMGVPTMYVGLLDAAKDATVLPSTLRMAISGGAPLPVAVIEAIAATFHVDVYEGYGLSETSPAASFNQPAVGRKPGSIGTPIWGFELGIVAPDIEGNLSFLGDEEIGEIVIRGHGVMQGYLNNPEATAAVMVDDWFRSGDLGKRDSDGFYFIVDRKKDMVLRGGYNVYPREVEEVLHNNPLVKQAAVFGMADAMYGEEVMAVVVPQDFPESEEAQETLAQALIDEAKKHLAAYKYPRKIWLRRDLPLGPSGKILKRELREEYRAQPKDQAHSS